MSCALVTEGEEIRLGKTGQFAVTTRMEANIVSTYTRQYCQVWISLLTTRLRALSAYNWILIPSWGSIGVHVSHQGRGDVKMSP